MLGEHLSQKVTLDQPYNPIFGQKPPPGSTKNGQIFFCYYLSKGRLNLWAKYSEPKKQIAKIMSPLGATRA